MTKNNNYEYRLLSSFMNKFIKKLDNYIQSNSTDVEVGGALKLLLLRMNNFNTALDEAGADTNSNAIKNILVEFAGHMGQDKLEGASYPDPSFYTKEKNLLELGRALFCLVGLIPGQELEIDTLKDFYNEFEKPADIHVISIGSVGVKEQQVYPWLKNYCEKYNESVKVSLFDEYFFQNERGVISSYNDICERAPEFVSENSDEWEASDNGHCFKNKNLNIQVNVYKSFPSWGFEQLVEPCVKEILTPMVIDHINRGNKVIISQHTGEAVIDQSLKDLYDSVEMVSKIGYELTLFGSNKVSTINYSDNGSIVSVSCRNVMMQYYAKQEHDVPVLTGFEEESINTALSQLHEFDMPTIGETPEIE